MAFIPKYDEYAANVSLLLPFDVDLTDYSAVPKTVTAYGSAAVSATQKKYGAKSCYFDGVGDRISSSSADFTLGTGDFSVEFWVSPKAASCKAYSRLIALGTTATLGQLHMCRNNTSSPMSLMCEYHNGSAYTSVVSSSVTIPDDVFSHIALTRDAGTTRFFINGILVGTSAVVYNVSQTSAHIGANSSNLEEFAGYIDEIRITKGIARYVADFTVPATFFQIEDTIPLSTGSIQVFTSRDSPWVDSVPSTLVEPNFLVSTEARQQAIPLLVNPAQVFLPKVASPWQDFVPRYSMAPQVFDPTNYRPPILATGSSPVWTRTANNPRFIKTEV